ncbi:phage tail tube protein [Nioella sp.]|uniref:phage tail tube protein n=1 Tax=Nioella sp. TaxID=1912091 RepID=UPI003512CBBF
MIYFNEKIFLLGLEATYGTIPALAASDAILATDIRIMPMEGQDQSRNLERPHMGAQATIPVDLHAKMSFKVELTPSGVAGTAPVVGKLLRALGCAETVTATTSVVYNPVSRNHESVGVHLWIGDTRFALIGARGTGVLRINASGIPVLEVELTGLWTAPTEAARIEPDLDDQLEADVLVATTANTPVFTVNAVGLVMRSFALTLGNKVEPRFLIGAERVLITGREEMVETTVEAVPLSVLDPFGLALARSRVAVALTHGTQAGKTVSLAIPAAQVQRQQGIEEQQGIAEWPLRLVPQPGAGNDQWTLSFT